MKDFDLLKRLTETPGIPGREERVRQLIRDEAQGLFDGFEVDAMGNLICHRGGAGRLPKPAGSRRAAKAGKRIMLACHIDEIGFYVKHIDDKGFLRVNPAGGFDTRNLHARAVLVQGTRDLVGVLNPTGRPVHLASEEERKKVYKIGEFFIDLGLPVEQVKRLVRVGDPVTLLAQTRQVGKSIVGKAMDNRVASFVALEAMRKVARKGTANEILYVATVQEEVGCRGAGPAAFGIEPDVAVALDVTLACDTPGVPEDEAVCRFGKGVAIKIMDRDSISDRALVDEFIELATKHKIPHQLEILPLGGTDAATMQRSRRGHKTITLSVPCRYVHTVTEMVHQDDLTSAIDLLAAYLAK
jgi:endoglucanase